MEMERGALYQIVYKQQTGNGRWSMREMTAIYLGPNRDRGFDFSLRPVMGTTSLSHHSRITHVKKLKTQAQISKMGGVRDRSLEQFIRPSRSLGYCDPPDDA